MASGRPPKPADQRARRNRDPNPPLELTYSPAEKPTLPATTRDEYGRTVKIDWHPQTLDWWLDWCESPQAALFSKSDWRSLVTTAFIADRFYKTHTIAAAAELRQREAAFGATPIDRLRLRMHLLDVDKAEDDAKRRQRTGAEGVKPPTTGKYAGLSVVNGGE